jgi:circadian clock protein KaiC
MVVGSPGAGKTLLAEQIAFHLARRGESSLYLTGYAEPSDKLVSHAAGLRFFDRALVGTSPGVHYGSLPDLLLQSPREAERAVVETVRARGATLVVLDGFGSIQAPLGEDPPIPGARFLYGLGLQLAFLGATLLVLVEGDPDEAARRPEPPVCDVVLGLRFESRGASDRRLLHVRKARGANPLPGAHPYAIDQSGVRFWPRLESVVGGAEPALGAGRAGFRQPDIDGLLGGGLTEGTVTLAAGGYGTGKTLLGLHFAAEGGRSGAPTLFLGFMESAAQLREKGRTFGLHLEEYERAGTLRLLTHPAYDLDADAIADLLRADVEARGVRRLVIDSAAQLERSILDDERKLGFLSALVAYLRGRGVTTFLPYEVAQLSGWDVELAGTPLAVLAENLLLLRHVEVAGELRRTFSILHMRFSDHDRRIHEYTIRPDEGIVLGSEADSAGLRRRVGRG